MSQEQAHFKYLRTGIQTVLVALESPSSQNPQGWKRPSRSSPTINLPHLQSLLSSTALELFQGVTPLPPWPFFQGQNPCAQVLAASTGRKSLYLVL